MSNARDLVTVFDGAGRVVYINPVAQTILGGPPESFIGRTILEFVHPDELQRAVAALSVSNEFGAPQGTSSFRLRRTDGDYVDLELTVLSVRDGETPYLATIGRLSDTRYALEVTLSRLMTGAPLSDVMQSVGRCFTLTMGSRVAMVWTAGETPRDWMSTAPLPRELSGIETPDGSPWATVRATGQRVIASDLSVLSPALRTLAEREGLGGYWIEPVDVPPEPALITLWMQAGGYPPTVHSQGMELAHSIIGLIMRWQDQQHRLDHAAFHDELTGLPNRKSFFRALEGAPPGAILYCDLDRFKPVNDTFGHAAGDAVLREIGARLRSCVRGDDLVARIGGDEFAILCPGSSAADAALLVERITKAVEAPLRIADASVSVGISIGVSHTTASLDEASVAEADRALYMMKRERKALGSARTN